MDQKTLFDVLTGYGNSCMGYFFGSWKICRIHAIRYDAAGSAKPNAHKWPGLRYVVPKFLSSCFLGHVIELLFYLFINSIPSAVYAFFGCEWKQLTSWVWLF